ncbi:hypothetical protein [Vagococcus intermedius]|uniref:Uncharacterized protein n=1 Tax=Vagococcus intermedius TaxID=2991418 RepID=A0AAF0CW20_9ENTE|nr:hypothetical protein [Vagococcus intermedius]WEG73887.1 hypothetical protein OL234_02955 [Vagococcus intermedius]WEG75971.1 hypothetical protein OL235_02965 [Vagococcus intermedius]
MHQAMVKIIMDRVLSQFGTETNFCQVYLGISQEEWVNWKKGTQVLESEIMQKIKGLFSDYEWMLLQKIIRQTVLFPEKRHYVVEEYKRVKSVIAKQWLHTGEAVVELISQKESYATQSAREIGKEVINLKVSMNYGIWGYDDILEFCLPAKIQQQIEDAPVDLLEWVNENLTDTYIGN